MHYINTFNNVSRNYIRNKCNKYHIFQNCSDINTIDNNCIEYVANRVVDPGMQYFRISKKPALPSITKLHSKVLDCSYELHELPHLPTKVYTPYNITNFKPPFIKHSSRVILPAIKLSSNRVTIDSN